MFQQHLIPLLFLELTKESGLLCFLFFLLGIFPPDIYIACLLLHLIQASLQISPYQRSSPCLSYIKWHPLLILFFLFTPWHLSPPIIVFIDKKVFFYIFSLECKPQGVNEFSFTFTDLPTFLTQKKAWHMIST